MVVQDRTYGGCKYVHALFLYYIRGCIGDVSFKFYIFYFYFYIYGSELRIGFSQGPKKGIKHRIKMNIQSNQGVWESESRWFKIK